MNATELYKTMTNNSEFSIREYVTPAQYFDPRKQILDRKFADYKNRPRQKKFKVTTKHKPCYLDSQIEPLVPNPSPDKYKTTAREGFFENIMNLKNKKKSKSVDALKKVDPKLKRGSYIDDIQKFENKFKPPGVGKFDITQDPYKRTHINLRPKQLPIKRNNMDDINFISNGIPGAGHYNPHKSVPHLKPNRTDYKFFKAKHAQEEGKMAKKIITKLSPFSYSPITANTFDSISKTKGKSRSRWSHGTIDIRKGSLSQQKSPSPAEYKLVNQWSETKPQQRQSDLGKVKLFERTSRSVKTFSVYH